MFAIKLSPLKKYVHISCAIKIVWETCGSLGFGAHVQDAGGIAVHQGVILLWTILQRKSWILTQLETGMKIFHAVLSTIEDWNHPLPSLGWLEGDLIFLSRPLMRPTLLTCTCDNDYRSQWLVGVASVSECALSCHHQYFAVEFPLFSFLNLLPGCPFVFLGLCDCKDCMIFLCLCAHERDKGIDTDEQSMCVARKKCEIN